MRFAYADPPYLGCGRLYAHLHPQALEWDDPERHRELIGSLVDRFPDGWALSLHAPSLRVLLPMCPEDVRVGSWVKPFASFKPNVNPGFAWEPVIWRGGRKREREAPTVRDWVGANIAMKKGIPGAKPPEFVRWVVALLGAQFGDVIEDLFPGSGSCGRVFEECLSVRAPEQGHLL